MAHLTLSRTQVQLIALLARGWTRRAIAAELYLSPGTVAFHIGDLLRRLNLPNATALVALAVAQGVLSSADWPLSPTGVTLLTMDLE